MVSATESAAAKQGAAAALAAGLRTLSNNDSVTFTKYVRLTLPLDGFVFWVKADLVTPSALLGVMGMNKGPLGEPQRIAALAPTIVAQGSLHYSTTQEQNEDETPGVSSVVFTSLTPVQEFNDVQDDVLWIGEYGGDREGDDGPITFAFSARGSYYQVADLFHYTGTAVLPVFRAQLIDSLAALARRELVVSNSLPAWLLLSNYQPPYAGFSNSVRLYPSFLVPDNLVPPYGAVHVDPAQTTALQSVPWIGRTSEHYQLARDVVRVTLYGLTNRGALDFLDAVLQYSYDYNTIGMMSMPVVRDDKRTSTELGVVAMKKIIDFEVSYTQTTMRGIARQLVERAIVDYRPLLDAPVQEVGVPPQYFSTV